MLEGDSLEVTVPVQRRRRLPGVVIHQSADLYRSSVVRRSGIPTTDPMRALVDLATAVYPLELEDALDRALVSGTLSVAALEGTMERLARQGRPGVRELRRLLDDRALGTKRPASLLEPRMARLLRSHGLPPVAFQHVVRHEGRFVAKVDFAYPAISVALEVDGRTAHGSPRAFQSDLERQNDLVTLGWTVIRFTWHDVTRRPTWVASTVRAGIAAATRSA